MELFIFFSHKASHNQKMTTRSYLSWWKFLIYAISQTLPLFVPVTLNIPDMHTSASWKSNFQGCVVLSSILGLPVKDQPFSAGQTILPQTQKKSLSMPWSLLGETCQKPPERRRLYIAELFPHFAGPPLSPEETSVASAGQVCRTSSWKCFDSIKNQFRFPQLVGWLARALLVVELVNMDQHLQCVGGPDGSAELGPVELGPASVSGRTRRQLIAQLDLATRGSISPGRSSEHSSCLPIKHTYMPSALILSTVFQSTWSIPIASMLISPLAFILPPSMLTHYSHLREIRTVMEPLFNFSYTNTIYVSVSGVSDVFILLSCFLLPKNLFHEIHFFPNMP